VHLTSLAVNGLPSRHLTPWRKGRVSSVPSSFHDQLVAKSGTTYNAANRRAIAAGVRAAAPEGSGYLSSQRSSMREPLRMRDFGKTKVGRGR
jgi:hypothetical protein